jgi:N-sulfoglucosamine sulfohydrolase
MKALAPENPQLAARLDLFEHRVPEELYDYAHDPDALTNLIDNPKHQAGRERLTKELEAWMVKTGDPMLEVFRNRSDPKAREAYMVSVEQEAKDRQSTAEKGSRRAKGKAAKAKAANTTASPSPAAKKVAAKAKPRLIDVEVPASLASGEGIVVKIHHKLTADLGKQILTVTLKGSNNQRIERKTVEAEGTGVVEVKFDVPSTAGDSVSVAAFVGDDFKKTPEHANSMPIPVRSAP